MWPYWILFALPALAAVVLEKPEEKPALPVLCALIFGLTVLIGYRYEVGGDWFNYFHYLDDVRGARFTDLFTLSDPGYQVFNWLSNESGWGIFGVNLLSGLAFSVGLVFFIREMPRPWLALAVAVPYLVIVVAMGYSRQGIALGLAMLGFVALQRERTVWFVVCVLFGAMFHKTAVVLIPIAALAQSKNRVWSAVWAMAATLFGYVAFLEEEVGSLYVNYVEAEYQSGGALIRLLMNVLPALLMLKFRDAFPPATRMLWIWMRLISVGLFSLFFLTPASTALDRIALYMLPLQLYVFAHAPKTLSERFSLPESTILGGVLGYYFLVQFVWLNFGVHSKYWLPYRFYLFQ